MYQIDRLEGKFHRIGFNWKGLKFKLYRTILDFDGVIDFCKVWSILYGFQKHKYFPIHRFNQIYRFLETNQFYDNDSLTSVLRMKIYVKMSRSLFMASLIYFSDYDHHIRRLFFLITLTRPCIERRVYSSLQFKYVRELFNFKSKLLI